MSEFRIGIRDIINARKASFSVASNECSYNTRRGIDGYRYFLPLYDGKTFFEHLEEKVELQEKVTLLDVGAGKGHFLDALRRKYPGKLELHGISGYDYRRRSYPRSIDYQVGDVHNLRKIFNGLKFDFVVSVCTFQYVADTLSALRQVYGLLNSGGIAFIDKPSIGVDGEGAESLRSFWKSFNIDSEFSLKDHGRIYPDLAIKRDAAGPTKLPLPFTYIDNFPNAFGFTSYSHSDKYLLQLD